MNLRFKNIKHRLSQLKIDTFLIIHPPNISYLTGFNTEESFLLITRNRCLLITDFRYIEEYGQKLKNSPIEPWEIEKNIWASLKIIKKHFGIRSIHFEQNYTSFAFYERLRAIFSKVIPAEKVVEELRLLKDAEEIKLIRKSTQIAKRSFNYISKQLKENRSEAEIESKLEYFIRRQGLFKPSFEPIVASGENSSFPHAKLSNRPLKRKEPVLIDIGVEYQGYKSDLTRVYFLGKMDALFKRILFIIKEAQYKAISIIKPGVSAKEVDDKARNFIRRSGFSEYFRHSLGHGIGLEVHEAPQINSNNTQTLKPGMVFTIEPAIYLPNKFGIRIEDMVLVTNNGVEILS